MLRTGGFLALLIFGPVLLPLLACCPPGVPSSPPVQTASYRGSIHGAPATASVSFEPLKESTLMSGEIRSAQYRYTFTADLFGSSGYGDMVAHADNSRFRIKIDLTTDGFQLTSNPQGPGTPSTYSFVRE
jgi:hypothetical protein